MLPVRSAASYAAVLLADHFGVFEEENLQVEFIDANEADARVLIQSGSAFVAPLSYSAGFFNFLSSGGDIRYVAPLNSWQTSSDAGIWARPDLVAEDVADPCQFEGKTVAFGGPSGLGSNVSLPMADFLAECDLTLQDITVSPLVGTDAIVAVQVGAIDATVAYEPATEQFLADDSGRLAAPFYRAGSSFEGVPLAGYVVGSERTTDPDLVDAFVRALARTTRTYLQGDYHQDPEVKAALVEVLGLPEAFIEATPALVFDPDLTLDFTVAGPLQEVWHEVGDLLSYQEDLQADDLVDPDPRARVLGLD